MEIVKYISFDVKNQYLINSRMGLPFAISFNHYGELKIENNQISTHFDFNVSAWR
jgi:hypothetical protein